MDYRIGISKFCFVLSHCSSLFRNYNYLVKLCEESNVLSYLLHKSCIVGSTRFVKRDDPFREVTKGQ